MPGMTDWHSFLVNGFSITSISGCIPLFEGPGEVTSLVRKIRKRIGNKKSLTPGRICATSLLISERVSTTSVLQPLPAKRLSSRTASLVFKRIAAGIR